MPANVPAISLIVPCYNVEPYLRQCLDSLRAQTFSDFEALCINDGSTDKTLEILREYEAKDKRFHVIDKGNEGYGSTVNCGLNQAHGEWIGIVEPDDYLDLEALEKMYSTHTLAENVDIIKGSYRDFFDDDPDCPLFVVPELETAMPHEATTFTIDNNPEVLFHHPSIWTCLYRRSFLEEHSIRMVEAPGAAWTDNPWFYDTFLRARTCVWLPHVCYFYRQKTSADSRRVSDVTIPFDRLREMRGIIEQTGYASTTSVQEAQMKRSFAYIDLCIDKWGFSENDPHVRDLITEVIDGMDSSLVATSQRIPNASRTYYSDFTGVFVRELHPHEASSSPLFSVILMTYSDRRELWNTIHSLTAQKMANFEVLCVDNASIDRSREILDAVAAVDKRFTCLFHEPTSNTIAHTLSRAKAPWVFFLRPGERLKSRQSLGRIHKEIRRADADVIQFSDQSASCAVFRTDFLRRFSSDGDFFSVSGDDFFNKLRASTSRVVVSDSAFIDTHVRERYLAWRRGNVSKKEAETHSAAQRSSIRAAVKKGLSRIRP